ncbi:MAG: type VII toxin-antitoxin system HepT family RNase toxin [Elusimicrobiota bacterium]
MKNRQDAIILNLQRACEATIDLAMHIVSEKRYGIPQNSREAFDFLIKNKILKPELGLKMKKMIGFRNIAIHDYQSISQPILIKILNSHLKDFLDFLNTVKKIF